METSIKTKVGGSLAVGTRAVLSILMASTFFVGATFALMMTTGGASDDGLSNFANTKPFPYSEDLYVTINTNDPPSSLVLLYDYVTAAKFSLRAGNAPLNVRTLNFQILEPDGGLGGGLPYLYYLRLYESDRLIADTFVNTDTPAFAVNEYIQGNSTKNYVVKASFNSVPESGRGIRLKLSDAAAFYRGEQVAVQGLGKPFNSFSAVKSLPVIEHVTYNPNGQITSFFPSKLIKFKLTATPRPFSLYKLSFDIFSKNVYFRNSDFYLYEADDQFADGNLIARGGDFITSSLTTTTSTGDLITAGIIDTYLDINDDNPETPGREHRPLSAFQTKYYTLKAWVIPTYSGSSSVSTTLLTDEWFANTQAANAEQIDNDANNDFIWSDLNFELYSTSTATNNVGWFNGFRIPGFIPRSQFI